MTVLSRLAGPLLLLAVGVAWTELLPALRRRSLAARLGYGYLVGVVTTAGALWIASHALGLPLRRRVVLPIAAAPVAAAPVAAALAVRLRRTRRTSSEPERPGHTERSPRAAVRPLLRVAVAATAAWCAFVTSAVGFDAVAVPIDDWDGRMIWLAHARYIRAERTAEAETLRDGRWWVNHPKYPLLLPLAQVAVQETFSFSNDSRFVRPVYAGFLAAFLLVLYDAARRRAGPGAACVAVLSATLLPSLTFARDGGPGGAYSDFPLACFFGAGLLLLAERRLSASHAAAAGLLLAGAVLTKNEGLPLALLALGAAGGYRLLRAARAPRPTRGEAVRRVLLHLAPPAALLSGAALLLASWRAPIVDRLYDRYQLPSGLSELAAAFHDRLPELGPLLLSHMATPREWGYFWWGAPAVLLLGAAAFRRRPAIPLVLGVGAALGLYVTVYSVTGWVLRDQVYATWSRFLTQLSLPGLVLFAMALREAWGPLRVAGRRVTSSAGGLSLR